MIKKHSLFFLFCIATVFLYIFCLSRSVYGGDVGDLVTAASLSGVAHPPGYPLFTILGFLLSRFAFLNLPQAFLVGLISALSGGIGLIVFYFLSYSMTKNRLSAFLATSILAFVFPYWFYAEIAEVFALNSLFAIILFTLAYFYRKNYSSLNLFLLFVFLGLSLANHQTIILIFPSILLLIAMPFYKSLKKSKKVIFLPFLGFLLGLSPYIYIPIAASKHPVINWDNVHEIKSFLHLVLRQDYGTFQAGIFDKPTLWQRFVTLRVYLMYVVSQLTIPVVSICLLGLFILWKKEKTFLISIILAFLVSGPLFIFYAGFPLTGSFILGVYERFFALSSIILLIPFSIGVYSLAKYLSVFLKRNLYLSLFQIIFFAIPITLLFYNFPKTNLSQVMIGDTYAQDLLNSLPAHTLLAFNGDTLVFNTWYVHYVRKIRPDVTLYNFGGEVQNNTTNVFGQTQDIKKNLGNKLDTMISKLIDNSKVRPVFSTILLEPTKDDKKIRWIPYGLAYKLTLSESPLPPESKYLEDQDRIWSTFRIPTAEQKSEKAYHDLTISEFPTGFSNAALALGTFLYTNYSDTTNSEKYYKMAVKIDPENYKAYETLGTYYISIKGKCPEVAANLTAAISLNPFEKLPYFLLYSTYKDCFNKKDAAEQIAKEYTAVFQEDFSKALKKQVPDEVFSK
ncbi:MAG TPA: DUF2723 domain-containing protein [Patescibacteria group bacterium]